MLMLRLSSARALALWLAFVFLPSIVSAQGALTNGANHTGAISSAGEIDEWTFTAGINESILLSIGEVLDSEIDPDFRPWIRLRRPDGVEIGSDPGVLTASINIAAPLSGTYTVLVRDYTGGRPGTNLGSYILHFVRAPGPYTHGDDGGALTNGGNHPGRIGAPGANPRLHLGDLDVWTFQAAQNESIALSIGEVLDSEIDPDFRPWIRLYGPTGAYITQDAGFLTASINVAAPLSGTYTVVVGDWIGGREGSHVGDYILHFVRAPGPYTHGDDGGALTNGGNHPGRIGAPGANPRLQRGDLDVWTFQAAQNESIALSIGEVLDSEIDPDFRPWIRLYGPTGAYITQDAGFLTASINVAAPLSGTYTVVVGDWIGGREGSHVGDYILHFVKAPGPYTVPTGDDGGPITHGANFPGRIGAPGANPRLQRGDLDVYTFCAVQGVALTINVSEITIPTPDPDFQPWIHLYRPDGRYLTQSAGVVNTSINVNAPLSGQYTVIVADWIGGREGSHVGDYVLSAFGLTACPSPPTTTADAYSTAMNTTLTLPAPGVLANDNSNGGGALSAQLARTVSDGTLTLNANGGFTFTPPAAFTGTTSFTYRALNAAGAGNEATVTITVTAGTPPTTIPDNYDVTTGTTLNEAAPGVLGNDSSNGHGALTAELVTPTTSGIVALNTDGSFAYTPNAGFVGADSFTYRAVSSVGPGTEARVSIRVTDTGPQPPTELYAPSSPAIPSRCASKRRRPGRRRPAMCSKAALRRVRCSPASPPATPTRSTHWSRRPAASTCACTPSLAE